MYERTDAKCKLYLLLYDVISSKPVQPAVPALLHLLNDAEKKELQLAFRNALRVLSRVALCDG